MTETERLMALMPLIKAHSEGAEIEFLGSFDKWWPILDPDWNSYYRYRIKPEVIDVEAWVVYDHDLQEVSNRCRPRSSLKECEHVCATLGSRYSSVKVTGTLEVPCQQSS